MWREAAMKLRMCREIAQNLGRLLSYDFWEKAVFDKDFPAGRIILLTLFTTCADLVQMVIVPGYPDKAAR